MPCRICNQRLDKKGDNTLFKHYLREHPIEAAKTWKCCIPKHLKEIEEVKKVRKEKGWS